MNGTSPSPFSWLRKKSNKMYILCHYYCLIVFLVLEVCNGQATTIAAGMPADTIVQEENPTTTTANNNNNNHLDNYSKRTTAGIPYTTRDYRRSGVLAGIFFAVVFGVIILITIIFLFAKNQADYRFWSWVEVTNKTARQAFLRWVLFSGILLSWLLAVSSTGSASLIKRIDAYQPTQWGGLGVFIYETRAEESQYIPWDDEYLLLSSQPGVIAAMTCSATTCLLLSLAVLLNVSLTFLLKNHRNCIWNFIRILLFCTIFLQGGVFSMFFWDGCTGKHKEYYDQLYVHEATIICKVGPAGKVAICNMILLLLLSIIGCFVPSVSRPISCTCCCCCYRRQGIFGGRNCCSCLPFFSSSSSRPASSNSNRNKKKKKKNRTNT